MTKIELALVPDGDMSEYEEDKPPPGTGVPCGAWTMLALGAVAGAAAATCPGLYARFFPNNPTEPTATDLFFPTPNTIGHVLMTQDLMLRLMA